MKPISPSKDKTTKRKMSSEFPKTTKRKVNPDSSTIYSLPVSFQDETQRRKIEKYYADKYNIDDSNRLKFVHKPLPNDVLCGRGNAANFHAGNTFFRNLVKRYKINYISGTKSEKQKYSDLVYSEIRNLNPPGRFLKYDPVMNAWHDISEKKAMEKIRQALREGASDALNAMISPDRSAAEMMLDLKNMSIPRNESPRHDEIRLEQPVPKITQTYAPVAPAPKTENVRSSNYEEDKFDDPPEDEHFQVINDAQSFETKKNNSMPSLPKNIDDNPEHNEQEHLINNSINLLHLNRPGVSPIGLNPQEKSRIDHTPAKEGVPAAQGPRIIPTRFF